MEMSQIFHMSFFLASQILPGFFLTSQILPGHFEKNFAEFFPPQFLSEPILFHANPPLYPSPIRQHEDGYVHIKWLELGVFSFSGPPCPTNRGRPGGGGMCFAIF